MWFVFKLWILSVHRSFSSSAISDWNFKNIVSQELDQKFLISSFEKIQYLGNEIDLESKIWHKFIKLITSVSVLKLDIQKWQNSIGHLLVQSQQWKHQNKEWDLLTLSEFHTLFCCFHCWFLVSKCCAGPLQLY